MRSGAQGQEAKISRARLQKETGELHNRIHRLPIFCDLLAETLTAEEYDYLVQRLYGFYLPLDKTMQEARAAGGAAALLGGYRNRAPLLAADLSALGTGRKRLSALPLCEVMPNLRSEGTILGTLYVVEGAILGGKLICKKLDTIFGPEFIDCQGYYRWCADQDKARWMSLCGAIERCGEVRSNADAMVSAAKQTFQAMLDWFLAGKRAALSGDVLVQSTRHA